MTALKVLLIENDSQHTALAQALEQEGWQVVKQLYTKQFLAQVKEIAPALVMFHLHTPCVNILHDLHLLSSRGGLPIVMFAQEGSNDIIQQVINAEVTVYVVDGFERRRLNSIINVALARFEQQQALKQALHKAQNQLEDRKQIDRAKAILIKTRNFSEDEAYHTLRKLAMDRKITLGEMAKNVIAMAELLK